MGAARSAAGCRGFNPYPGSAKTNRAPAASRTPAALPSTAPGSHRPRPTPGSGGGRTLRAAACGLRCPSLTGGAEHQEGRVQGPAVGNALVVIS